MTQKELIGKIKAEIERRIDYIKSFKIESDRHTGLILELTDLLSFIESLEQSIDADKMIGLDEAAHNHAANNGGRCLTDDIGLKCFAFNPQEVEDAFKAGAEWMAEQGETMEVTDYTEWADVDKFVHRTLVAENGNGADIIQIRKK